MSLQPRDWQSTETQPLGVCLSGDSSYFLLACHQMHFEAGNLIDIYLEDVEEQFRLLQTARHCPLIAGELCNSGTTCRLRLSEALWGCPSVGWQMPSSRDSSRNGSCSWQNPVLPSPQIREVMAFWNPLNASFWRFQSNPSVECSSSVSGSGLCFLFYFIFFSRSFTSCSVWEEKVLVCLLFIWKTLVRSHSCAYHLFKWRQCMSSWALEIKRYFEILPLTAS